MNVGVIGAGRIGKIHASNLVLRIQETNVVAIADVVLTAAQETAARLNIPKATADYHELINDPNIEAVVICSATDTHTQIIIEAAQAGKHIFCEKPIDLSLKRIDEALAAVRQAGVKLQIGFNRRFDANYKRIRQAVETGEIGTPYRLSIVSRDPAPPPLSYVKSSGGIFLDMTIHDFDMARFLVGSEVEEVYTVGGVLVDPAIGAAGDLDTLVITLKFANGVIGTIDNCRKAVYGYDQRAEVFGSDGSAASENNYPNSATISTAQNIRRDLPLNFFLERYTESYLNEVLAFVDAVKNNKPVPVSGEDARVPVVMGLAARKSYDENRPVKLSEITV
ncbi:MAG TPA: inositol 2-dehydrogenase [Phototrophicaceae bacterium]|nr:inositol 2-dehydrogenase [Phototrophicaceae bacterium]